MPIIEEDFVIEFHIGPAVLKVIDPDQFWAIPKSSTEQALISILHYLSRETDGTSAAVRLVLFDYKKVFDNRSLPSCPKTNEFGYPLLGQKLGH